MFATLKNLLRLPACDLPRSASWCIVGLLLVYTLLGTVAMDHWQHRGGQSLQQLGFGYGVLIRAIERTGTYRVEAGVHYPGVAFSAHRLPFIPYFLLTLRSVLGDDLGRIAAVKCLLFNALLILALLRVQRTSRAPAWILLLLLGFVLTMPRWGLNVFEVGLEEGYNIPVLVLLFSLLWFGDAREQSGLGWLLTVGLLLILLLFLKSSMLYWCIAVPVLVGWRMRDWRALVILLGLLVAGLVGLAFFNRMHAGRFTVGSSWEGWSLYKGNNGYAMELYPPYSLDILDQEGKMMADRPLKDEWDYNEYFRAKAVAFIRSHPGEFLELTIRKAWIFFGEVRATGLQRGESRYAKPLSVLQLGWMLAFRALLWAAILLAVRTVWSSAWRTEAALTALTFLAFLALYSGFHLVGFAYERHVMPIVMPTAFYLLRRWSD